jgi:uncharacterized phosphosugar-binding protein
MSAEAYFQEVIALQHRLHDKSLADITKAGNAVARALEGGHRVWVTNTAHGVAHEVTKRAGGFIAVHELIDVVHVQFGDCVLIGSPVGVAHHTLSFALGSRERGGTVVALTNVAFEQEASTIIEHPSGRRLHEVADIVVDIGGPTGDGVFEVTDLNFRVIPHSGVTLVTGLWMIFSEALAVMRSHGLIPRLYQCDMVQGARERNSLQIARYVATGVGYLDESEVPQIASAG